MTSYDYISVSLHGHFDNRLAVKFSYTPAGIDADEWQASLPDPEAIVRNFVSARECYVMWQNAVGHYFGLITTNPLDPRTGRVMVTLMVRSGDALPGNVIFRALNSLKKVLLEDGVQTEVAVMEALKAADVAERPMALASWVTDPTAPTAKPMCYRTYLSTRELDTVFSFPNQPEYTNYLYTIVITATSSLRPGLVIDRLTAPVKKRYTVVCPDGVTASAPIVTEGERLELKFAKDGFSSRKETVVVGTMSPYVRYEGSAIIVKSPNESGMGFTRKVRLTVKSVKGSLINGYTITVNDRPVNTMEPFVELTEVDLQPGRKIDIQAASNNYHPFKMQFDPVELDPDKGIEIVMSPIEQGIILKLDFGEGRVFEQQISIEKNTPEYSQLHSGNFHGFRAHRQVGPGEVYNIDVRAAGKPVAPAFDNVASTPAVVRPTGNATRPEAPKFENLTGKPAPEAPKFENVAQEAEEPEQKIITDSGDDSNPRKPIRWSLWVSLGVLAVVIVLACIFLPKMRNATASAPTAELAEATPDSTVTVSDSAPATPQPAPAPARQAAPAADELADFAYLNSNRSWKRDSLRSEAGKALFKAIEEGNIDAFVNNPYLIVEGRATNKEALKIADMVWGAKGTDNQRGNELKLQKSVKDGAVNVWDLYEAVATVKPKEPNQTPRPRK